MTLPLTPSSVQDEPSLLAWQKRDQGRTALEERQVEQDKITTPASKLGYGSYYNRLQTISNDSASATSGSIAADNQKKAYDAAVKAQEWNRQQQQSLYDAYQRMKKIESGAGFGQSPGGNSINFANDGGGSAGWGSGGAQGVANVLRAAGFPESSISTMVAIAKAESGWNPGAINTANRNGSVDRGLFQINSIHQGNPWYPSDPMDPLQNAKAAYAIFQSQGLGAWSVYNSGKYREYLQAAPPVQPYVANTSFGLQNAQVGQAQSFTGVPTTTARAQAMQLSLQVLNIPYVWGGNSLATGVDCSGLVQQVYNKFGISMPRTARDQATTGVRVSSYNQLQPGDLVAFKWAGGYAGPNTVSHIAIYAGNGEIIEAASGAHGDRRKLGNSAQDQGAIYIHTRFPGE